MPVPTESSRRAGGPDETRVDTWIKGRKIRDSTIDRYARDIRMHLKPAIGTIRLDRLRVSHLSDMFAGIVDRNAEVLEANALRRAALDEL